MSSANALQLATTIQGRVGSSLLSVNSMLPPPEAAAAVLQAGGGSLGVFLLKDLAVLQERTYECVEKVASILQSQLDLSEDSERRARDQASELAKEKNKGAPPLTGTGNTGNDENFEDLGEKLDQNRMSQLLTAGLTAAMLAPGALKALGMGLGKKLLKGGMYGSIATFVADPIIDYVNTEFDLELDEAAKKDIKLSMIGAGVGLGLAGIPGAIVGATAPMIAKVAGYISGSLNATEVKDSDFAATAIGGAAASMWTVGKLGALMGASKIGAVATFGAAIGALPVIIGVGAAVALGVGAAYLAKKIDEYQELTLQKLEKTTAKLDKEMGEWAAREEEGLFERFGMNLGKLSALGEAKVATQEALEQLSQDKDKFMADENMQTKLGALAGTMTNYSEEALKTIMLDRTKAVNFMDTVESIKGIAAQGGFGADSKMIFEQMSAFSDKVQKTAVNMLAAGETGGLVQVVANNNYGRGGDRVEKMSPMIPKLEELKVKQAEAEEVLRLATLVRMAEDEEQKKKALGAFRDFAGLNTSVEKAEIDAKKQLASIKGQVNFANDTLQGLGVNFTYDQLADLYSDDKKGLQKLIERSVNQSGAEFLKETQVKKSDGSNTGVVINNNGGDTSSVASQNNYIKKLDIHGDPYIAREGFVYGL